MRNFRPNALLSYLYHHAIHVYVHIVHVIYIVKFIVNFMYNIYISFLLFLHSYLKVCGTVNFQTFNLFNCYVNYNKLVYFSYGCKYIVNFDQVFENNIYIVLYIYLYMILAKLARQSIYRISLSGKSWNDVCNILMHPCYCINSSN